jgi:hypothetical protein
MFEGAPYFFKTWILRSLMRRVVNMQTCFQSVYQFNLEQVKSTPLILPFELLFESEMLFNILILFKQALTPSPMPSAYL